MSTKNHFAKNEILLILLIPPLSGELPIEAKKSEFRHEHSSYSKIKVNNQLNMRIETKPDERSIESKLLHRFVNGCQLMPNNSLNIYEIYTKSNLEVFGIGKYT